MTHDQKRGFNLVFISRSTSYRHHFQPHNPPPDLTNDADLSQAASVSWRFSRVPDLGLALPHWGIESIARFESPCPTFSQTQPDQLSSSSSYHLTNALPNHFASSNSPISSLQRLSDADLQGFPTVVVVTCQCCRSVDCRAWQLAHEYRLGKWLQLYWADCRQSAVRKSYRCRLLLIAYQLR
jgi:hypothetical protein